MLSKTITDSSSFLMMPLSSQALYMHLNQHADDDGYCEYFGIMRMCGANADDLSLLRVKNFVQVFDEKVLILKDWNENNYIQQDRYHKSKYFDVYKMDTECIQLVHEMDTEVRIGKDSIVKDNKENILSTKMEITSLKNEEIEEMKSFWKENAGTTLRNHVEENLKDYRFLLKELGEELKVYLQAVRVIKADKYQKRALQSKLINYSGLREKLEEVEGFIMAHQDQKSIKQYEDQKLDPYYEKMFNN